MPGQPSCLSVLAACVLCRTSEWATHCQMCWASMLGSPGASACASGATCMLVVMRGTLGLSALPCNCAGPLPCPVLHTMQLFMWQGITVGVAQYVHHEPV